MTLCTFLFRRHLDDLLEGLWLVDSELGQNLTIEVDSLLLQSIDEDAVFTSVGANSSVQADNPEGAEVALLLLAIHVCVLTSLNNALLCMDER